MRGNLVPNHSVPHVFVVITKAISLSSETVVCYLLIFHLRVRCVALLHQDMERTIMVVGCHDEGISCFFHRVLSYIGYSQYSTGTLQVPVQVASCILIQVRVGYVVPVLSTSTSYCGRVQCCNYRPPLKKSSTGLLVTCGLVVPLVQLCAHRSINLQRQMNLCSCFHSVQVQSFNYDIRYGCAVAEDAPTAVRASWKARWS